MADLMLALIHLLKIKINPHTKNNDSSNNHRTLSANLLLNPLSRVSAVLSVRARGDAARTFWRLLYGAFRKHCARTRLEGSPWQRRLSSTKRLSLVMVEDCSNLILYFISILE